MLRKVSLLNLIIFIVYGLLILLLNLLHSTFAQKGYFLKVKIDVICICTKHDVIIFVNILPLYLFFKK